MVPLKFLVFFMFFSAFFNTAAITKRLATSGEASQITILLIEWVLITVMLVLKILAYCYDNDDYILYACNLLTLLVGLTGFDIENNRVQKAQISLAIIYRMRSSALWFLIVVQWMV